MNSAHLIGKFAFLSSNCRFIECCSVSLVPKNIVPHSPSVNTGMDDRNIDEGDIAQIMILYFSKAFNSVNLTSYKSLFQGEITQTAKEVALDAINAVGFITLQTRPPQLPNVLGVANTEKQRWPSGGQCGKSPPWQPQMLKEIHSNWGGHCW